METSSKMVQAVTFSTLSVFSAKRIMVGVGVVCIEGVPTFTVSQRLSRIPVMRALWSTMADCSSNILCVSDHLKVATLHAIAVSASLLNMIPLKSRWRFAIEEMMGKHGNLADVNSAVPLRVAVTNEKHAAISPAWVNLRPKALFGGKLSVHRKSTPSGVMQPGVDASRLLPIVALLSRPDRVKGAILPEGDLT